MKSMKFFNPWLSHFFQSCLWEIILVFSLNLHKAMHMKQNNSSATVEVGAHCLDNSFV